jgi:hypothetical protein
LSLALILTFAASAHAQRRYSLGTAVNLTSGGANTLNGFAPGQTPNEPLFLFYGAFPSVTLVSTGAHSVLGTSYSYGFNRTRTSQNLNQQSHAASVNFSDTLSSAWKMDLSDSFMSSSNASTFNALRNVATAPTTTFVFSPVATQIVSRSNTANAVATYQYTDRSSLAFTMAHDFRDYGSGNGFSNGALLQQQRFSGDIAYNYKTARQESWTLGYSAAYFNFLQSENVYSQTVHAGYSNNIFRDFKLSFTAGISDIQSQGTGGGYVGYNSSASLEKKITNSYFLLHYTQTSGEATGLGTVSDTRRAGFSFNHAGGRATEFVDISAFDTKGTLGNPYNLRAASATGSFGLVLAKDWSVQVGGVYQKYDTTSSFAFTQKSAFISLRYNNPTLWTGLR